MISSVAFLPRDPADRRGAPRHFQLPTVHDLAEAREGTEEKGG